MTDNPLSGKVGLDTTDFKSGAAEMARQIRVIESGFKASAAALGDWGSSASGLEQRIKALNGEIEIQKQKVAATRAEYERIAAEKGATSRAAQDLEIKLNKENETLGKMQLELGQSETALEKMGSESGQAAKETDKLGKEEDQAAGKTSRFANALNGLKDKLHAGVSGLKNMVVNVAKVGAGLAVGLVAGAGAAVTGLGALLLKTAATSDELVETAEKIGITTTKLQELNYIADQTGTGLDTMQSSLSRMIRGLKDAEKAGSPTAKAFEDLGVAVKDSNGNFRDSEDIYFDTIDALSKIEDPTQRDILAMQLFGKSALELNPLINLGTKGMREMADQAHKLGAVMGEDTVRGMADLHDAIGGVKAGFMGLVGTLVSYFLPVANQIVAWARDELLPWLQDNLPKAIQILSDYFANTLQPALQTVIDYIVSDVLPKLSKLWDWLQTNIPKAVQKAADFWNNTLKPALQTVKNFIVTDVLPKLSDLWTWLQTWIPDATQKAADFWNNTLQPAFQTVKDFIVTDVLPKLSELWGWLETWIPQATQKVADFWNNTLQPAFQTVKDFIVTDVIPKLSDLWNWLSNDLPAAVQSTTTKLNPELLGAMTKVKDYIANDLGPAINTFATETMPKWQQADTDLKISLVNTLGPSLIDTFNWLSKIKEIADYIALIALQGLSLAFGFVGGILKSIFNPALEDTNGQLSPMKQLLMEIAAHLIGPMAVSMGIAIGFFKDLKKYVHDVITGGLAWFLQLLKDISTALQELKDKLPPWLKGGSPTPLENWTRGINDAMKELAETTLPKLSYKLDIGGALGGGSGQGQATMPVINVTVNAAVSSEIDVYQMAYQIAEVVQRRSGN